MPGFMLEDPRPCSIFFFRVHSLCVNYGNNMFIPVSPSVRSKQLLCFVHGQGQKTEQKHTTKNHSSLLTMVLDNRCLQ